MASPGRSPSLGPAQLFLSGSSKVSSLVRALAVGLVDINGVTCEDDTDHAHKHVRPARDHIDTRHDERCLNVLAHLSIEGLSAVGDHAWHRVNRMPLVGGDKVDRVAWFDPDKFG